MRAALALILIVIVMAYGMFFLVWNDGILEIVSVADPLPVPASYGVQATVGQILLGAAGAGAVVMLLLVIIVTAGRGGAHARTQAKLKRTRAKLDELVEKVKDQRERISALEGEASPAPYDEYADDPLLNEDLGDDTL